MQYLCQVIRNRLFDARKKSLAICFDVPPVFPLGGQPEPMIEQTIMRALNGLKLSVMLMSLLKMDKMGVARKPSMVLETDLIRKLDLPFISLLI